MLSTSTLVPRTAAEQRNCARGPRPAGAVTIPENFGRKLVRGERPVLLSGVGRVSWNGAAVDPARTLYDLASLTKVLATTGSIATLSAALASQS